MADAAAPPDLTVVTGATGWFGRNLIAELLDEGGRYGRSAPVRALVGPGDDPARRQRPRVIPPHQRRCGHRVGWLRVL